MNYTDFAKNIDAEYLADFYEKKTAIKAKNKTYRKKAVINTSLAASLLAVMTTGIWVIKDNGSGSNTSFPVLQNPSEDTPLPPVTDISEDISVPETSGTEIDWDTIRLNAVYGGGIFSGEEVFWPQNSGFYSGKRDIFEQSDSTVYAMCLYTYVKGYAGEGTFKNKVYDQLFHEEENRKKYLELEKIAHDTSWSNRERRAQALEEMGKMCWEWQCEAARTAVETVTEEDIGREKLFAELEKIGIKVFTQTVEVYMDKRAEPPTYPINFYVVYVTNSDCLKMKKIVEENGDSYGITLVDAFEFLREDYEYAVTMDDGYFVVE